MKHMWKILLTGIILNFLVLLCCSAMAEENKTETPADEWTVLIYLCGSDLESKYGYATENLEEIYEITYPYNLQQVISAKTEEEQKQSLSTIARAIGNVNILIETGGCSKWHANSLGMEISTEHLQRWQYNYYPESIFANSELEPDGFELIETLPLQSMGDPEPLTDFIRWATKEYPAKKYALVLWDHGGGAGTGLFIDELFNNDTLLLHELGTALDNAEAQFETVVIDACLMANIETAWMISNHANWLVASEEDVPGKGTAIGAWLQQLVNHPGMDGKWLGRCVCDLTAIKYANGENEMAKRLMTWSLINLDKIENVITALSGFLSEIADALVENPTVAKYYSNIIYKAEEYGDGWQNMRDFGSILYNDRYANFAETPVMEQGMRALNDAVDYLVRGPGRSSARGLSFCYPADFTNEELDKYADNFPMAHYLAYLDAITDWTAPDWVYHYTDRFPAIDSIEELKITITKKYDSKGFPAVCLLDTDQNADDLYYRLYRQDEATGDILLLGRTNCGNEMRDGKDSVWSAADPFHWPAIDGELCCINLVQGNLYRRLYNIPAQINSERATFRCGRSLTFEYNDESKKTERVNDYEIYGLWEGYDEDSELLSRSVMPLSMKAGQEYRLLYPKDGTKTNGGQEYESGKKKTLFRALDIGEIPLPAGTYFIEYEIRDMFMRTAKLDRFGFRWDGHEATFPEGFTWEGTVEPKWENRRNSSR